MTLDEDEAELLRRLTSEMQTVLEQELKDDDPVLERLFPAASEDPAEAREYRTMVGGELKSNKLEAVVRVRQALGDHDATETTLDEADVQAWLVALNDMRLALGVVLDVDEEKMSAEIDPDDPEGASLSVLHWLGWVQGSILDAITAPNVEEEA